MERVGGGGGGGGGKIYFPLVEGSKTSESPLRVKLSLIIVSLVSN